MWLLFAVLLSSSNFSHSTASKTDVLIFSDFPSVFSKKINSWTESFNTDLLSPLCATIFFISAIHLFRYIPWVFKSLWIFDNRARLMNQFLLPCIRDTMISMSCISWKRCKCLAKTGIPVSLQYGSMIVNIFALYDLLRNNSFMKFKPTVWRSLYVASCSSLQGGEAITATKSAEEVAELYQNTGS